MSLMKDSTLPKSSETGLRYNEGKMRWSLVSLHALQELIHILEGGAVKYAPWNWSNGLSWTQTYDSLQRHLQKWMMGEERDAESGRLHLGHVFCNAMFLLHFAITKTGTDDRPAAQRKLEEVIGITNGQHQQGSNGCGAQDPVVPGWVPNLQADLFASVGGNDGGVAGYCSTGTRCY